MRKTGRLLTLIPVVSRGSFESCFISGQDLHDSAVPKQFCTNGKGCNLELPKRDGGAVEGKGGRERSEINGISPRPTKKNLELRAIKTRCFFLMVTPNKSFSLVFLFDFCG